MLSRFVHAALYTIACAVFAVAPRAEFVAWTDAAGFASRLRDVTMDDVAETFRKADGSYADCVLLLPAEMYRLAKKVKIGHNPDPAEMLRRQVIASDLDGGSGNADTRDLAVAEACTREPGSITASASSVFKWHCWMIARNIARMPHPTCFSWIRAVGLPDYVTTSYVMTNFEVTEAEVSWEIATQLMRLMCRDGCTLDTAQSCIQFDDGYSGMRFAQDRQVEEFVRQLWPEPNDDDILDGFHYVEHLEHCRSQVGVHLIPDLQNIVMRMLEYGED